MGAAGLGREWKQSGGKKGRGWVGRSRVGKGAEVVSHKISANAITYTTLYDLTLGLREVCPLMALWEKGTNSWLLKRFKDYT